MVQAVVTEPLMHNLSSICFPPTNSPFQARRNSSNCFAQKISVRAESYDLAPNSGSRFTNILHPCPISWAERHVNKWGHTFGEQLFSKPSRRLLLNHKAFTLTSNRQNALRTRCDWWLHVWHNHVLSRFIFFRKNSRKVCSLFAKPWRPIGVY